MRFRVASRPPVKPLKAWFDIPNDGSVIDILGVKSQLCSRLRQLAEDGTIGAPTEISLFIDDFELLDDSGLDVIQENDLVHISSNTRRQSRLQKRKPTDDQESTEYYHKKRRLPDLPGNTTQRLLFPSSISEGKGTDTVPVAQLRKNILQQPLDTTPKSKDGDTHARLMKRDRRTPHSLPVPSTSEDEDTESDSTSSTESSSTSSSATTSTTSDSSSDSSSSSSFTSKVRPSELPRSLQATQNKMVTNHVPPGQGKPSTHSRNARRRMKRMYEKQQKELEQATVRALLMDSVNAVPLGAKSNTVLETKTDSTGDEQDIPITPPVEQGPYIDSMITSLRNKNKKKGFKQSMVGVAPQRMVFTHDAGAPPESGTTYYSAASSTAFPVARLVTPSEKQANGLLPSNMFVTSVEVESENWDKKKKVKQRDTYGDELATDEAMSGNDGTILNYGEPELDWESVDRDWEKMHIVADPSSLASGVTVGWKALAINPTTFTPETLVHVARVKEIKHDSSLIVVEPIQRPGSDNIAFGSFTHAEGEIVESDSMAVEDMTYSFEDALTTQWRLVKV
ncbi:hypothetical protein ACEPAI_5961 [Sanghuangporus weigelae]